MQRTTRTRLRNTMLALIVGMGGTLAITPGALAKGQKDDGREQRASGQRRGNDSNADKSGSKNEGTKNDDKKAEREKNTHRNRERDDQKGVLRPERRGSDEDRKGDRGRGDGDRDHGGRDSDRDHGGHDGRYDDGVCNTCPAPGAGILKINGCAYQIGNDNKLKKIAKAFRDAGYEARVRTNGPGSSVRVYGFPSVGWQAGKMGIATSRSGNVLDVRLCN